jgi:hypothetical protein
VGRIPAGPPPSMSGSTFSPTLLMAGDTSLAWTVALLRNKQDHGTPNGMRSTLNVFFLPRIARYVPVLARRRGSHHMHRRKRHSSGLSGPLRVEAALKGIFSGFVWVFSWGDAHQETHIQNTFIDGSNYDGRNKPEHRV